MNLYPQPSQITKAAYQTLNRDRIVNQWFSKDKVGECIRLLSDYMEADPSPTKRGWEEFYGLIQGYDGLTEASSAIHRMYPAIDLEYCKRYVHFRVIGQTWNGYQKEMNVIEQLRAEYPKMEIKKTSFEVDHEFCIDVELFSHGVLLLGIQVKPSSYIKMNTPYQQRVKEAHKEKNEAYKASFAPYIYVYYEDDQIVDKQGVLNQIDAILQMGV